MIYFTESDFAEVFNDAREGFSKLKEIIVPTIVNAVISDVGSNKEKCPKKWTSTKRVLNGYKKLHNTIVPSPTETGTFYRQDWYGRTSNNSDPNINPITFAENLIEALKDKGISVEIIEGFLYLWFGGEGLSEFNYDAIEKIIHGLKTTGAPHITNEVRLMIDTNKLDNTFKNLYPGIKYFDKSYTKK